MYVCIYVCTDVYGCRDVWMYAWMHGCMGVCMHILTYVRTDVCMRACISACTYESMYVFCLPASGVVAACLRACLLVCLYVDTMHVERLDAYMIAQGSSYVLTGLCWCMAYAV